MSRARAAVVISTLCLLGASAAQAGINFAGVELVNVSPRPEFIAAGDLDNDDRDDIVVVSPNSKELNVFLAADTPSRFAPARVLRFGDGLRRVALGDLNRDNRLDVVVADQSAKVLWILMGRGDGTFLTPYQNAVPNARNPYGVAIADFDGSGGPEIAVSDVRLGKVFVLRNDNQNEPRFTRLVDLNPGEEPNDVQVGDFNDDGHVDLVTLNLGGPRVKEVALMIWRRAELGTPDFAEPQKFTVGERPSDLLLADFNGDDNVDVAMLNRSAGVGNSEIDVLLSTGQSTLLPPVSLPIPCPFFTGGAPCRALSMAAADFDRNDTVDLVVALADPRRSRGSASSLADAMQIFSGRGDGNFGPGGVFSVQKNPISLTVGDVSGDGKSDIIIANQRTLSLQAFVNLSTPATGENGDDCLTGDECISSRCTNGVCCASQCDLDEDEVCNVPGREGICVPVSPDNVQECDFPEDCDSGFCVDGFCCDEECGGGRCDLPGFEGLCIPGACDGCECNGDDRECESGFCSQRNFVCCKEACETGYCDDVGVCHELLDLGEECNLDDECGSEVCDVFDGICCNRKCDEVDEFCSVDGRCTPFGPVGTPTPTNSTPSAGTPTPTRTQGVPTPGGDGELCSVGSECESTFCVNNVCCQVSSCPTDQHCAEGSGECAPGTPAVRTPTPTRTRTIPVGDPCQPNPCPPGQQCLANGDQAQCIVKSSSGGCSTGEPDAPSMANLLMGALLPLGLWFARRQTLAHAAARARKR